MSEKHQVTLLNCLMAILITPLLVYMGSISGNPALSLIATMLAILLPMFVGTRVAFRTGYDAGRRSATGQEAHEVEGAGD